VPIFTVLSSWCDKNEHHVTSKVFDTISIFQYQATIFLAQYYQMNSKTGKLSGLNLWFIIEILSFYGYILSAMFFILEHSIKSSLGKLDKTAIGDYYKYDFLAYFRLDCDWYAFITILTMVNIMLMIIESRWLKNEAALQGQVYNPNGPLQPLMW